MFAVDHVLVSDALLDAPFACHLGSCLGACCVVGDQGAPLEPDERAELDAALPVVRDRLRPEALREIERSGTWEGSERDGYHTTTVGGNECVFVVYDEASKGRRVATCALQEAFQAGKLAWEKPVSCHLYPIRAERYGEGPDAVEVLNVERVDLCAPAIPHGRRTGVQLADFLEQPLTRKYGAAWVERFRQTLARRRDDVGVGPRSGPPAPDLNPSSAAADL